jgi:hypothetical protein
MSCISREDAALRQSALRLAIIVRNGGPEDGGARPFVEKGKRIGFKLIAGRTACDLQQTSQSTV